MIGAEGGREGAMRLSLFSAALVAALVGYGSTIALVLAAAALWAGGPAPWLTALLVGGLLVFGFVFAVNSAIHSYLILAFGDAARITRDVGFYYMANAAGRLLGTLLSGLSFQLGGLALCLATAGVMAGLSWWAASRLRAVA